MRETGTPTAHARLLLICTYAHVSLIPTAQSYVPQLREGDVWTAAHTKACVDHSAHVAHWAWPPRRIRQRLKVAVT